MVETVQILVLLLAVVAAVAVVAARLEIPPAAAPSNARSPIPARAS